MGNLSWLFGILFIMWAAWFITGGPDAGRTDRPFLRPPAPVDSGDIYGPENLVPNVPKPKARESSEEDTSSKDDETTKPSDISFFGGDVSFVFSSKTGARFNEPDKEYIKIIASQNNTQPTRISGWRVKSAVTGKSFVIGQGAYLPYTGRVNSEKEIFLLPGESAVIQSGRSPLGVSFRLNSCTGYLEQFQDYSPALPQQCPHPANENIPQGPGGVTDACFDFLENLRRCEVYIKALPPSLSEDPVCQEYISKNVSYNGCVDLHKNDKDFYKNEWRVFLGRDGDLWKAERETILLLDADGKLVDSISY
jgi:hypothetical protein